MIIWPQVQARLPDVWALCTQADPRPLPQARHALYAALHVLHVPEPLATLPPDLTDLEIAQASLPFWATYAGHARAYRSVAPKTSPAWEFWLSMQEARDQCAHYGMMLYARDGFDVTRWRWRPGYAPLTAGAVATYWLTCLQYAAAARRFRWGMRLLALGLQQFPLYAALQAAARVLRELELTCLPLQLLWLTTLPPGQAQVWACGMLHGWVRTQVTLRGHASVRQALAEVGLSLETFIRGLLDESLQGAWPGIRTPQALVAGVKHGFNVIRRTGHPIGRPRAPRTTAQDLQLAKTAPYAVEALAQQQARWEAQHELGVTLPRSRLSPQETRVSTAWHKEGLTYKEIATQEGIKVSTVGSILHRATKKLQAARNMVTQSFDILHLAANGDHKHPPTPGRPGCVLH
jgi:DNA-binding CsgD family transcriptional regulator